MKYLSCLCLVSLLFVACVPISPTATTLEHNAAAASQSAMDEESTNSEAAPVSAPIPVSEFAELPEFDPANFTNPTVINNPWFPLIPGTQLIYEGFTEEDGESIPHRIVMTVTDLTKEMMGIRTIVMWDRDFSDDRLEEAEIALFAQGDDGHVWHFGQYPEVYEEGAIIETPGWFAGYADAQPGITVKGEPDFSGKSYSQGWGPAVGWTDRARAVRTEDQVCIAIGCYEGVLLTEETSLEEAGAFQLKYYAPGVGNIKVDWSGSDDKRETLELVEVKQLNAEEMAEARAAALELEARAYVNIADIYGETKPME